MKVEFQNLTSGDARKPEGGTMEVWYGSRYHWRRTYTGPEPYCNGTEWRVSKTERSISKPPHNQFSRDWMILRIDRPVVNPQNQERNIKPDVALKVERLIAIGTVLN